MRVSPALAKTRPSLLVIVNGQLTGVETIWLALFPEFGSVEELETVAWFVIVELQVCVCETSKAMVTVFESPLFNEKLLHSTFDPLSTQLGSDKKLLKVRPEGTGSEIVTLAAAAGPLFVAVTV